ncbi:glycoside hydrolase 5 family protein [Haloarcula laminariae]|uniref:hypothetical protein n=1 Tax=Haloarcula laminariae TaxID=2961577 RepID=UPI00240556F1|nr:hypothetical protein [Halomicroarcula sp. FL173]
MRERFPADVREKRLSQGLDPTEKPTHQWLKDNGYRQFLRRCRELGYTPDEFLLEECGFEEPSTDWPCHDQELIDHVEEWIGYHDDIGERINGGSIGDARCHLRRIMEISEECVGTTNLLKYGRGEKRVCVQRSKRLMEALKETYPDGQSRTNYITTFRDFVADKQQEEVVDHDLITPLVARSEWSGTRSRPKFVPTTEMISAYFGACETRVEQMLILCLGGYGVRPSELCGKEDQEAFWLDAEVPHLVFSSARKNGAGRIPLVVGVGFVREYFRELAQDPEYNGEIFPSSHSADGARSTQWVRDKVSEIGERTDVTLPNGEKLTPQDFRQFWYTTFAEAYVEWLERADTVASIAGSSSGRVAAESYFGDSAWFKHYLNYMQPILESVYPAEIEPADELGNVDVEPDTQRTGQTDLTSYGTTVTGLIGRCLVGLGGLTKERLQVEYDDMVVKDGGLAPPRRLAKGAVVSMAWLILIAVEMATAGVYIDPVTMEAGTPFIPTFGILLGSVFGTLQTLWIDYKARIQGDPNTLLCRPVE